MVEEPLLDISEVAKLLKLPASWLYQAAQSGKVPAFKVGRYWRFSRPELLAWLEQQRPATRTS